MSQLFLSFFGDGPHWDNILLVPGYPSGYSYPRPFRYRDAWIQDKLVGVIADQEKRRALVGSEALLCMRFLAEEHKWRLVPVRKVSLTHVEYLPGQHSIYFCMGPFYDFRPVRELSEACLDIDVTERDAIGDSLLFASGLQIPGGKFAREDDATEEEIWVRFSDLVAKEATLPINREARRGLFLRFRRLGREAPAPLGVLFKSWHCGEVHGSILSEGSAYELVFFHRIPMLIGTHTSVRRVPMEYQARTGNVELSRAEEELTGNYQTHTLSITALKPSGTWEEIVIAPKQESVEAQDGQAVNGVKLSIPIRIKRSMAYRIKTAYVWLLILWGALFGSVVVGHLLAGRTELPLILLSGLLSAFSTGAVFLLQQRGGAR